VAEAVKIARDDYTFLDPAIPTRARNLTDHAESVIAAAILRHDLKPGSAIDKRALAERLGMSRLPVSEALSRLKARGLVDILPQSGTRVTLLKLSEVKQCLFLRRALERATLLDILPRKASALLPRLDKCLIFQEASVKAGDRDEFHARDLEFHQIFQEALALPRVNQAVEEARQGVERVRRLLRSEARLTATIAEHVAIRDCVARGDGEAAARAMERHIDAVGAETEAFAHAHPEEFEDLQPT
jgi:DNA-binding GntR family transcriptional regulator